MECGAPAPLCKAAPECRTPKRSAFCGDARQRAAKISLHQRHQRSIVRILRRPLFFLEQDPVAGSDLLFDTRRTFRNRLAPGDASLRLLILLAAYVFRVAGLTYQSLWRDEVDAIRFATRAMSRLLQMFVRPGENGPLYFLLLRPWLAIAGRSEFSLRYFSVFWSLLAVALLYALARRWIGKKGAGLAALLMAVAPYQVWYAQEGKMYAMITAMVLFTLYALTRALDDGGPWWLATWISASLSLYVHVLAVLAVPLALAIAVIRWKDVRRHMLGAFLCFGGLLLPYLPLAWWHAKLFESPKFRPGFPFVPFPRMLEILANGYSGGILGVLRKEMLFPMLVFLLGGLFFYRGRKIAAAVFLWLLLPPLALYLVSLRVPLFTDRYLIWVEPAFVLALVLGFLAVERSSRPIAWALLGMVLGTSLLGIGLQDTRPVKSDFRSAAAFVRAHREPGDLYVFLIPYVHYTYLYYDPDARPWSGAPYTNGGMSETMLDEQMKQIVGGHRRVWLVSSEAETWDSRGLVRGWLGKHGEPCAEKSFTRVDVVLYCIGPGDG